MPLNDVLSSALAAPAPEAEEEIRYIGDTEYHNTAYMVESALREVGVLPDAPGAPERRPYDDDLRRLIESVPME